MASSKVHIRTALIAVAAVVHLTLVGLGASHVFPELDGWPGRLLHVYGEASGASGRYSFFAPDVGSQLQLRLHVVDEQGRAFEEAVVAGTGREVELRIGNIFGGLWSDLATRDLQRAVAASMAAAVFGRRSDAVTVSVRLEAFDLPSMTAYHAGQTGKWRSHYEAKFKNSSTDPSH